MQRPIKPLPDEYKTLIAMVGDVVDGLESFQVLHADCAIEDLLGTLRYAHHRLTFLTE